MKFYETSMEEYIASVEKYNIHPELKQLYDSNFPQSLKQFENLILYGPVGSGKYSQVLTILKKYSPSDLKYEKKMTVQSEKQTYTFHISDIHYEIDMSFLGCNSKNLWHDIFMQIVDVISVKNDKIGIIVCKNFHMIHSELLEIFYSYLQQSTHMNIMIKFIILTEHISFLPTNIINGCAIVAVAKPAKSTYIQFAKVNKKKPVNAKHHGKMTEKTRDILQQIDTSTIINLKEIHSFSLLQDETEIPRDIFNTICDTIIQKIGNVSTMNFMSFRDALYDILIYNLDVVECVWYILSHFIMEGKLESSDISDILQKTHVFLQYFNNNYRPIYHLESIMFYIISKLNKYDEKGKSEAGITTKRKKSVIGNSQKGISSIGTTVSSG